MHNNLRCTLLSGETNTKKRTESIAEHFKNCPYVYFIATNENRTFAVPFFSESQANRRVECEKKNPRMIVGSDKAKVTITHNVLYPDQLKLRSPRKPQEKPPSGLNWERLALLVQGVLAAQPQQLNKRRKGTRKLSPRDSGEAPYHRWNNDVENNLR